MSKWMNEPMNKVKVRRSVPIPSRGSINPIEVRLLTDRVHWHLLASCLTLNKPLNISDLQFFIYRMGTVISSSGSLSGLKLEMYIICIHTPGAHLMRVVIILPHLCSAASLIQVSASVSLPGEVMIFRKQVPCSRYCPKYFTSAASSRTHANPR